MARRSSTSTRATRARARWPICTCRSAPARTSPSSAGRTSAPIYGLLLTAWGTAGFAGPLLISAIFDATGSYEPALYVLAGLMLVSALLPLFVRPPARPQETSFEQAPLRTGVGARASEA